MTNKDDESLRLNAKIGDLQKKLKKTEMTAEDYKKKYELFKQKYDLLSKVNVKDKYIGINKVVTPAAEDLMMMSANL